MWTATHRIRPPQSGQIHFVLVSGPLCSDALLTLPDSQAMYKDMLTSADCRAKAELKIAQARRGAPHPLSLINAAQSWLLLARRLRAIEGANNRAKH